MPLTRAHLVPSRQYRQIFFVRKRQNLTKNASFLEPLPKNRFAISNYGEFDSEMFSARKYSKYLYEYYNIKQQILHFFVTLKIQNRHRGEKKPRLVIL